MGPRTARGLIVLLVGESKTSWKRVRSLTIREEVGVAGLTTASGLPPILRLFGRAWATKGPEPYRKPWSQEG